MSRVLDPDQGHGGESDEGHGGDQGHEGDEDEEDEGHDEDQCHDEVLNMELQHTFCILIVNTSHIIKQ